jgi:hypothetical protein
MTKVHINIQLRRECFRSPAGWIVAVPMIVAILMIVAVVAFVGIVFVGAWLIFAAVVGAAAIGVIVRKFLSISRRPRVESEPRSVVKRNAPRLIPRSRDLPNRADNDANN